MDAYEVGYGKPPKATRFKSGQSGNPSGRPKGKRNFATVLFTELNSLVSIIENGRSKQVTKLEAATKQLANRAAAGDLASMRMLIQLMPGIEAMLDQQNAPVFGDAQDREVLAEMLKRFGAPGKINANDADQEGNINHA
jgi:hypothetical protein